MRNREFWLSVETEADRGSRKSRVGPVRVALLFGTMAIAMSLFLPPMVNSGGSRYLAYNGLDSMTTGAVPVGANSRQYVVRRSILQEPGTFCVMDGTGRTQGNC